MSALGILAFLALMRVCSSQLTADCSYLSLLRYLNLSTSNDVLAIMRPVRNWTTPTLVQLDMLFYGILGVDEKSQTVTSHIWVQMSWTNEFLMWNSSDFCGIDKLTVPISRLWIPDITIQEDASDTGSIQKASLASLYPYGWVFSSARQRLTSTCQLKLWLFPFDTQNCNITFGSMSSADKTLKLGTFNNDTTLTKVSEELMVTQGEWQLANMEILNYNITKNGVTQCRLIYMVRISRKPMLYVINLIVPLFYLLILDLASFFVSEARGEKLSFKVTVLLSISVLLLILQDMLPSTEDQLPLMASYCIAIFALVGISVLEAMLVSFLSDLDGQCDKEARRSDKVEIELEDDCPKEPVRAEESGHVTPDRPYLPLDASSGRQLLKLILEEVKAARQEAEGQRRASRASGYYKRVALVVDSVFFALYFLTVVIFLTYMYIMWLQDFFNN